MKVLLSLLKEFAPIDGEPDSISEQLSELGLAVEEMVRTGEHLEGVVVAKVLDLRPHPDADRIQIVEVDSGDGKPLQICCGAFNMSPGDFVPLATVGTVMPNGMEISRRKLRGEWSNGMLCSSAEINLGEDHDGILILGSESEQGTPLADSLGIESDVLYDLEVNPNRPDAMSLAGVARDLAAYQKAPFKIPVPKAPEKGKNVSEILKAEIISPDLCGRFMARVIDGISIQDSPQWLKNRITALGMRPVNNVVDVSNYVMLELGQPSHTFDLDCVKDSEFKVRWASDGEEITTLDGVVRNLTEQDGVVTDGLGSPIGIAGVMGGASTEISESTSTVALEMAWWNPSAIAKTSRRLGLRSEASAEKTALIDELKQMLEESSRAKYMERDAQIAQNTQDIMYKVPYPIYLFPVLKAFVAPILPDPTSLISFLRIIFVRIKPNGIDPIKYDINIIKECSIL